MTGSAPQRALSQQSLAVSLAGLPLQDAEGQQRQDEEEDSKEADAKDDGAGGVEAKEGFQITDQTLLLPTKRLLIVLAAASTCILLSFLEQVWHSSR